MLSVFDGLRDVTTLSVFVRLACALICGGGVYRRFFFARRSRAKKKRIKINQQNRGLRFIYV